MGFPAILMGGGAAVSAIGSIFQGNAEASSANYAAQVAKNNATIATQNATYATEAGAAEEGQSNLRTAQQIGSQRAGQAAGNLDVNSGSALDVQASTKAIGNLNALTIRNNAARQAYGYQTQAQSFESQSALDKATASNDETAGYLKAGTSLLSGASSISTKFGFNSPDVSGSGSGQQPVMW